jgi:hypothetical protein
MTGVGWKTNRVGEGRGAPDQDLDELYRAHPSEFVAIRNELVKELRANDDRDRAERLKKRRRPTTTAWLINRVALDSPELVEEFAATSRAVEDAQRRALEGDEEATTEWRSAAAREREATTAMRDAAERAARDSGHPANSRGLELMVETLRAAGGDQELRDRVLRGRVEREQSAARLGILDLSTSRRGKPRSRRGGEAAQARRERKLLASELADATAREERLHAQVQRSAEALRRDKAKLAESKRETRALRRRLKAGERQAGG